jgi:hypothetical protein
VNHAPRLFPLAAGQGAFAAALRVVASPAGALLLPHGAIDGATRFIDVSGGPLEILALDEDAGAAGALSFRLGGDAAGNFSVARVANASAPGGARFFLAAAVALDASRSVA